MGVAVKRLRIGRRRAREVAKTPLELALAPALYEGRWSVPQHFNFASDVVEPLAADPKRRALTYLGRDGVIEPKTFIELSDGAPVSTPELCRAIARALGKPARLFPFPPSLLRLAPGGARLVQSQVTDDTAIRAALGWRPPCSMEQGLASTAAWFRARAG